MRYCGVSVKPIISAGERLLPLVSFPVVGGHRRGSTALSYSVPKLVDIGATSRNAAGQASCNEVGRTGHVPVWQSTATEHFWAHESSPYRWSWSLTCRVGQQVSNLLHGRQTTPSSLRFSR